MRTFVRLKSGGPAMLIVVALPSGLLGCTWGSGRVGWFPAHCVQLVRAEEVPV